MTYLCEILSEASNKFPSNIAIVEVGGKQLTYKDLQEKAVLLKHTLEKQEIGMGHRVGVLSSKRIETVAGIFGISYSGAAYVPMDVEAPVSRNLFILGDCQVNALIIEASVFPEYKDDLLKEYCNVALSTLEGLLFFCRKEPFSLSEQLSKDIAFILYTSGSTGKPKGVMITHQNALSFILWANEVFDLSDQDVFASIAPFHFDLSVFDLYVSFRNGAQLLLIDAKTARNPRMLSTLIDQRKISIWYSTPTLLKLMLQFGKLAHFEHQSLRYVLFAGEVFPIPQLTRIKRAWSNAEFYNLYGPTETNVCTFFKIPKIVSSQNIPFPIGKVCSFAEVKIVDPERKCQEVFEGELWVSGLSVSPGYWEQAEKDSAAFVVDTKGQRWYKTGDWAKINEAGDYEFIGRKDRMVKRRGYRIELAEIEAALYQHPQLFSAAVVAMEEQGELHICAFYQKKKEGSKDLDLIELQEHCLRFIPKYMLPDTFVPVVKIPQTSTQKVDYQKLLE